MDRADLSTSAPVRLERTSALLAERVRVVLELHKDPASCVLSV